MKRIIPTIMLFLTFISCSTDNVNDIETQEKEIILNNPTQAIFVPVNCWHEFNNFSPDCVLLCFSSVHYLPGENNYITDKSEFLASFKNV